MPFANNDLQNAIRIVASLLYSTLLDSTLLNFYPCSTLSLPLPVPLLHFYAALLCSALLYSTLHFSTQRSFTLLYFYSYSPSTSTLLYSALRYSIPLISALLYATLLYTTLLYPTLFLLCFYSTLLDPSRI